MRSVVVARADEIAPGKRKLVSIGGRSIGVFNLGGEYYALRNRCPHQGGPLCEGFQFAPLRAAVPGEPYARGDDGAIIRCPWHGWEFDLRTGRSWFDPQRTRVRSYPTRVRAGAELTEAELTDAELTDAELTDAELTDAELTDAELTDAELTDAGVTDAELTEAELRAETYPARLQGDYVVVEL